MHVLYTDTRFDTREESFIKKYANYRFFQEIQAGVDRKSNFFIQNTTLEYEHGIYQKETVDTFTMRNIKSYGQAKRDPIKLPNLFSGYLRLDDSQMTIKPHVYKTKNWLAEIGGLARSLFFIFQIANMLLGRQLFLREIIGDLFLMKSESKSSQNEN